MNKQAYLKLMLNKRAEDHGPLKDYYDKLIAKDPNDLVYHSRMKSRPSPRDTSLRFAGTSHGVDYGQRQAMHDDIRVQDSVKGADRTFYYLPPNERRIIAQQGMRSGAQNFDQWSRTRKLEEPNTGWMFNPKVTNIYNRLNQEQKKQMRTYFNTRALNTTKPNYKRTYDMNKQAYLRMMGLEDLEQEGLIKEALAKSLGRIVQRNKAAFHTKGKSNKVKHIPSQSLPAIRRAGSSLNKQISQVADSLQEAIQDSPKVVEQLAQLPNKVRKQILNSADTIEEVAKQITKHKQNVIPTNTTKKALPEKGKIKGLYNRKYKRNLKAYGGRSDFNPFEGLVPDILLKKRKLRGKAKADAFKTSDATQPRIFRQDMPLIYRRPGDPQYTPKADIISQRPKAAEDQVIDAEVIDSIPKKSINYKQLLRKVAPYAAGTAGAGISAGTGALLNESRYQREEGFTGLLNRLAKLFGSDNRFASYKA